MENTQNIKDLIQKFYPYAKNALGFEHPVRVIMRHDAENAEQTLGNTAYYDPENKLIVLYVTNRHHKDILRSFSHELVHHAQNCRGDLGDLTTGDNYAEDGKGREIEKEAYLQGNLNVRDWEDNIKYEGDNQMNEHYQITKENLRSIIASVVTEIMDEEKVEEEYSPAQDDEHAAAQELGARLAKKKKIEEVDEDDEEVMDDTPALEESKKESPKEIIKEVPRQPKEKPKQDNKTWYNTSLFNKLMSKWAK